jgi:hypothetical protein
MSTKSISCPSGNTFSITVEVVYLPELKNIQCNVEFDVQGLDAVIFSAKSGLCYSKVDNSLLQGIEAEVAKTLTKNLRDGSSLCSADFPETYNSIIERQMKNFTQSQTVINS